MGRRLNILGLADIKNISKTFIGKSSISFAVFVSKQKKQPIFCESDTRQILARHSPILPSKAPGYDSICTEFIIHDGAALKFWLRDFLSSCLLRLKIPKIWRKVLVVAIQKPMKPVKNPKSYRTISLLSLSPTRLSRDLSTPALSQLYCSLKSRLGLDAGSQS